MRGALLASAANEVPVAPRVEAGRAGSSTGAALRLRVSHAGAVAHRAARSTNAALRALMEGES